jgi:hypothetical protein
VVGHAEPVDDEAIGGGKLCGAKAVLVHMGHREELEEFSGAVGNGEEDNKVGQYLRAEPGAGALTNALLDGLDLPNRNV